MNAISCPFCNAPLSAVGPARDCLRCGERLPASVAEAVLAAGPPGSNGQLANPAAMLVPREQRLPKHTIRGLVVGVMGIMAILGLTVAWATINSRRANDFRPVRRLAPPVRTTAPSDLAALGWLPPATNVIVGLHVADLRQTPAGAALLQRFRVGNTTVGLADLEQWTGLAGDAIDHAVLGISADKGLVPPVVLVVATRQPYDLEKVRAVLKASRSSQVGARTLYHFTPAPNSKLPLEGVLWGATPTILVVGLSKTDLDAVPASPARGGQHLSAPLREFLTGRLSAGTNAWVAGHAENWQALGPLLNILVEKENLDLLTKVRTFGCGLSFGEGVALQGALHCPDPHARQTLEKKWGRLQVPRGDGLPPEFEPVVKELEASYQLESREEWLTLKAESGPQAMPR